MYDTVEVLIIWWKTVHIGQFKKIGPFPFRERAEHVKGEHDTEGMNHSPSTSQI